MIPGKRIKLTKTAFLRVLGFAVITMLASSTAVHASSKKVINYKPLNVEITWSNPVRKPIGIQKQRIKFTFANKSSSYKLRPFINLEDALDQVIATAGSPQYFEPNGSGTLVDYGIYPGRQDSLYLEYKGHDLVGSKPPYTLNFIFDGWDMSKFMVNGRPETIWHDDLYAKFVFEVPTTIKCYKKGYPLKSVKAYQPKCPKGFLKK